MSAPTATAETGTMRIINFGHPMTEHQRREVETLAGEPVDDILHIVTQFDPHVSFVAQIDDLLMQPPLRGYQWQTEPFCVNLPSFAPIAAVLLARLHGLCGHFPPVLVLRRSSDRLGAYSVAEIINLQALRDAARHPYQQTLGALRAAPSADPGTP